MSASIIHWLSVLRSQAVNRNDAVEAIPGGDWADQEKMWASRSWSRQCNGLGAAILAEAPTNIADVLSVLLVAQEKFEEDVIMEDDVPANSRAGRACEQIRIALANCIVTLADAMPPTEPTPTALERQVIDCSRKSREWWLPSAQPSSDEGAVA